MIPVRKRKTTRERVDIREHFQDYEPPIEVAGAVRKLLNLIPDNHLQGLTEITIRNSDEMPRRRRRSWTYSRSKKVKFETVRGLYVQTGVKNGKIELFINNIFDESYKPSNPFARIQMHLDLGETLFHEIGHHVDHIRDSMGRLTEGSAERYQDKYTRKLYIRTAPLMSIYSMLFMFLVFRKFVKHPIQTIEYFQARRESRRRKKKPYVPDKNHNP